jgi:hypothetical protein|tara:strand:- start:319 stop:651 length:333 start_codon:yes stop_codon:yes gene_type:complete
MAQKNIIYDAQTRETTVVDYTSEEQAVYDDYNSTEKVTARKLEQVKAIRLTKLRETDYLANSDVTMPDNIKTWRQSLRDLPQNNTTEEQYDALLARDDDGNLTNSIWSKP